MSIARELVRLGLGIRGSEITPQAYAATTRLVIDTVGCLIAGYNEPGVAPVLKAIEKVGTSGPAHLLVYGGKARMDDAVLLNGTMIHALDLDDTHCPAVLHLMSKLFPTVLAVGEMCASTGQSVIEAIIAGMEIAGRIGRHYRNFPFLNSNIAGGFGVTLAACRLLSLNEDQCVHAFGIYHAQNSGNRQALLEAALCKRIQPAFAARNAIWAALLAQEGFTGPELVFEGEAGVFKAFMNGAECPSVEVFTKPAPYYEVEQDSIKSYPTCGAHHGAIMAAEALKAKHSFEADDIERVDLFLFGAERMVGAPFRVGLTPQVNAQFSAPYAVAAALLRGKVELQLFRDQTIRDNKDMTELARKVVVTDGYDGELPTQYPHNTMRVVRVFLKNGQRLEKMLPNNESSLFPERLSDEDVKDKFHTCAAYSGICPSNKADEIVKNISALRTHDSIEAFVEDNLILLP